MVRQDPTASAEVFDTSYMPRCNGTRQYHTDEEISAVIQERGARMPTGSKVPRRARAPLVQHSSDHVTYGA